ncbi:hypothetical protein PK35_05280 [Tamlana nanhaiensis]|uniref:Lipoprotein n=1 Tax=Neotamlana nanhaiensis TaxID=1382798 RepID=A0A0D7W511_9FLAO|nr:hypothetical protein [Tamlana nanhaiensis]KJD34139.1 hypothetical protein PK35_05280 [Tamlana nanhaiensis]
MNLLKQTISAVILMLITMSFSQCASINTLEKNPSVTLKQVYYETWVAGVKGGGSGVNLFLPIQSNTNKSVLDSVYFQGKGTKLELINQQLAVGRFKTEANRPKQDIIMSNEPYAEYGQNRLTYTPKIPFELEENECVISYLENGTKKYFKVDDVVFKKSRPIPSVKPQ